MVHGKGPTNAEFDNENEDEINIVPIKISVEMCVVPTVKSGHLFFQKSINEIDSEVPLNQYIKQINYNQIDHKQVDQKKGGSSFVLKFWPVYFEHFSLVS